MSFDRSKVKPPFYANIFSYKPSKTRNGYEDAGAATMAEVEQIDGFLGYETIGTEQRTLFISYWKDLDAIDRWRKNHIHKKAKSHGNEWYAAYHNMIAKVESHSLWNPELL